MKQESYVISVGEPWDFESPDGQNIIVGQVLSRLSNECLVYKANHSLQFGEYVGDVLILSPRYKDQYFVHLNDRAVTVSGGLLLTQYSGAMAENDLIAHSKFVIVGAIEKQ